MLHLKLITPERTLYDEDVLSATLPTVEGEIMILPHHAPLTALLAPGIINVRRFQKEAATDELAVSGGFIHVEQTGDVLVLADTAERGHELDVSVIEEAKQRAKAVMREAASKDDIAYAAAAAGLERELARYRLAAKHRTRHTNIPPAVTTE